jgi:hypothetical protein
MKSVAIEFLEELLSRTDENSNLLLLSKKDIKKMKDIVDVSEHIRKDVEGMIKMAGNSGTVHSRNPDDNPCGEIVIENTKQTYWCCDEEFGKHTIGCENYKNVKNKNLDF